jgi:hypothetical protein
MHPEELREQGMGQVVNQEHPTEGSDRGQERGCAGPEHGQGNRYIDDPAHDPSERDARSRRNNSLHVGVLSSGHVDRRRPECPPQL